MHECPTCGFSCGTRAALVKHCERAGHDPGEEPAATPAKAEVEVKSKSEVKSKAEVKVEEDARGKKMKGVSFKPADKAVAA